VNGDADAIDAMTVPVPFTWRSPIGIATRRRPADIEVGQACEGETKHCASEDDDFGVLALGVRRLREAKLTQWEVVSLLEAKRAIYMTHCFHELVRAVIKIVHIFARNRSGRPGTGRECVSGHCAR